MITDDSEKGIYFWDNAHILNSSTDEGNVYRLADTFNEFLNDFSIEA